MERRNYQRISVLIANHERSGRVACHRILQPQRGIQVVGAARTGVEAIEAASHLKPRILLLHLNLLIGEKINLLRGLSQRSPRTKVLLITRRAAEKKLLEVLSHGAKGYVKESAIETSLPKAVRKVDAGEAWIPRKLLKKLIFLLANSADMEKGEYKQSITWQ
jgi:DNA-binding NarL/FixJ family response regulator